MACSSPAQRGSTSSEGKQTRERNTVREQALPNIQTQRRQVSCTSCFYKGPDLGDEEEELDHLGLGDVPLDEVQPDPEPRKEVIPIPWQTSQNTGQHERFRKHGGAEDRIDVAAGGTVLSSRGGLTSGRG